jgi:predicted permease
VRIWTPWRRRRQDDETRAEFESHLEQLTERYVRSGMRTDETREKARRQFGNVTWHREELHLMSGSRWIDGFAQDFRQAFRHLRHAPGFAAVVVATLALGIGGTTAVFSVLHAVLLAPLPYAEPGQLVRLYQQVPDKPGTTRGFSVPQFRMLRDEAVSFSVGARYYRDDLGLDLIEGGRPERLRVLLVSSDYFSTLSTGTLRGPGFRIDDEGGSMRREDRVGAPRVVLSDSIWRARFGADPAVVGRTVRLSGESFEVAGIAPEGFADPLAGAVDAWLPHDQKNDTLPDNNSLVAFGRLRPGVSLEQGITELAILSRAAKDRWPNAEASSFAAVPLQEDVTGAARPLLQLLIVAVGLVLLVACVNVANLMLVRATGRSQEFGIRIALGSGRGRLIRHLLVESLVLAGLGGIAGLGLAVLAVNVLQTIGHDALPRLDGVGFRPMVLAFAAAVTIATALGCGVLPALRLTAADPHRALTSQSRSATGTRWQGRLRSGLAAAQLALALALLAGAAVLSVSFYRLLRVDPGFRINGVLTFDVNLPSVRYDAGRRAVLQEELARGLAAIPGVIAAGGTSRLPAAGSFHTWPVRIDTGPLAGTSVPQPEQPEHRVVSGDFFNALAIPVLAGRTFDERDDAAAPIRSVVSANFARLAYPGMNLESVVGQRIGIYGRRDTREIIGVVGDVAIDAYGQQRSAVYTAHRQFAANRNWLLTEVVATSGSPEAVLPAVRAVVAAMDPELVVHRPTAMADVVGRGASRERFALILMGTFAGVSLALAAIGLYGVLAYAVRQRTAEIGIRIALGATGSAVRSLVFRQAAGVVAAGLLFGTAGALGLGRWLSSLLFQVSPLDPRVLTAASVLLLVVCGIAAWLPARRAARVTPREAIDSGVAGDH